MRPKGTYIGDSFTTVAASLTLGSKMEISMLFCCKLSATVTSLTDLQKIFAANVCGKM